MGAAACLNMFSHSDSQDVTKSIINEMPVCWVRSDMISPLRRTSTARTRNIFMCHDSTEQTRPNAQPLPAFAFHFSGENEENRTA